MAIDANSGDFVTLSAAQKYVADFRSKYPGEIKGVFVGANKVQELLNQEDCIGVRIYFGYQDEERRLNLVMVGVNSKGVDLTAAKIVERMVPCPSTCDITSALY
ncbi:MAG: hypothetical protein EOO51_00035 [Flavobacterium sp.]|nr:MAG: hypothetical protein EOO51_00035 [Flavobacterium sp.]